MPASFLPSILLCSVLITCSLLQLEAQSVITGRVKNDKDELLKGVEVRLPNFMQGTQTDENGFFSILLDNSPPFFLEFEYPEYQTRLVKIIVPDQQLDLSLARQIIGGTEQIVTASKIEERLLRAPVTIEAIGATEVKHSPYWDAFSSLSNVKGVQFNTGNFTFTSLNTRGFADMQNMRFIHLIDGIDVNMPGENHAFGSVTTPVDLDLDMMELMPGAGSALYGPNVFNGLLAMRTKDPFKYQGFSVEAKTGFTRQSVAGSNPFNSVQLRYAKAVNERFAFKISASAMQAHDWVARDERFRITTNIAAAGQADAFLQTPRTAPFFDAVSRYGDEVAVSVNLGDTIRNINRTGIAEEDLVNPQQQIYKLSATAVYRLDKHQTLRYTGRISHADALLRHTTLYPFVNMVHHVQSLDWQGKHHTLRTYYAGQDLGNTHVLLSTGSFIENGLVPNQTWAADYGAAYRAEVAGVAGSDHAAARLYADRNMPASNSEAFQQLLAASLGNTDITTGGAKLIDKTDMFHIDGNYDLGHFFPWLALNLGASFRRYRLVSEGVIFNDGPNGFNGPIPISEAGVYVQAGKEFWQNRLKLQASLRFDKNQNFEGRFTPRVSAVAALDKAQRHWLRASYQTGFRNPANVESFINLDIRNVIIMGSLPANLENYRYQLRTDNVYTGARAGTVLEGSQIFNNLKTMPSFARVMATGDTSAFQALELNPLVQERLRTYELGYRGLIANKLYLDASGYFNSYYNLVSRIAAYSPDVMRVYSFYTSLDEEVYAWGGSLGLEYNFYKNYRLMFNYTHMDFDADSARVRNPNFLPTFNSSPHRINVGLDSRDAYKGLGFSMRFQWTKGHIWESPFGQTLLPDYHTMDLAVSYQLPKLPLFLKLGASNVLGREYRQVYGGPAIGSLFFFSLRYDADW